MAETPSASAVRRSHIEHMKEVVAALLQRAEDASVKDQCRLAIRDLDEALSWLGFDNVDNRDPVLHIADRATWLAEARTRLVQRTLELHGSGARMI